jgi:plastocyanin
MNARTGTRPLALFCAVLLFGGVALAACGDDSGDKASDTTATTAGADEGTGGEVTIVAKDFSLTSVTAKPGEDVYLSNEGTKTHTVTADDGSSFDTGNTAPGKEKEFTAPSEPGTYTYHCSIHASMTGTLTVAA